MTTIEGGCLCGAVRYSASTGPIAVRACWCRLCQYFAAGNATINAVFPRDAVNIRGVLRDFPITADSGNRMHRRFCPQCGVHLFSEAESRPQLLVVRVGTLDDPSHAAPQGTIWTEAAPPWALLDPDLPRCPGQPPAPVLPDKAKGGSASCDDGPGSGKRRSGVGGGGDSRGR